eukprot:TRINITY_DN47915_c0_g1_i1.p1 TRINITY_DN47915_c0_g1~~TRINITY_DN47915_c0_g1_i1.p1  ORF type:complete len:415 (+),score=142.39 TRINITY_DN47915_c0_g1_i1:90-1247(+)
MAGLGMVLCTLGPSLLGLAQQTNSSLRALSWVFTGRSVGYLLGTSVAGRLADAFSGNPILAGSLAVAGASSMLVPWATGIVTLGVLISLQGVSMGVLDSAGNTLLLWLFSDEHGSVDGWMQLMHFAFAIGAVVAPLVLRWSLDCGLGYGTVWLCSGCLLLVSAAAVLSRPSPAPRRDADHHDDADCQRSVRRTAVVTTAAALLGLYVGSETGFGGFVLLYSHLEQHQQEATGQYLSALFWACIAVGRLAAVPLAAFQPQQILVGNLALASAGAAALALFPESGHVLWGVSAVYGLGLSSIFPTVFTLVERYVDVTGSDSSVIVTGAALGEMLIPVGLGYGITLLTPRVFPAVILLSTAAQCALFWVLQRLGSGTKKSQRTEYGAC